MHISEAKEHARKLFPYQVDLEKTGGTCRVLMPIERSKLPEFEKDTRPRLADGRIILGGGDSWLQAMRYAAEPEIKRLQAKEQERAARLRQREQEMQAEVAQFVDFLREKFSPEYEAWRNAREKPAAGDVPPVDANGSPVPAE